jgi:hypothetical protein
MTFGGAGRGGSGAETYLGGAPGAISNATIDFVALGNPALNLSDIPTLVPLKPTNPVLPGGTLGAPYSRALTYTSFDPNYTTPYIQNFTLSLTHQLRRNITVDLRYAGTQAKKQIGLGFFGQNTINLNTPNVFYNTELFSALETVRRGGEAPLFDQMFAGMNLNSTSANLGYGTIGNCVTQPVGSTAPGLGQNGCGPLQVLQSGSAHLRRRFATDLANGNYVNIANFINSNTGGSPTAGLLAPQALTNLGGRFHPAPLLRGGLPGRQPAVRHRELQLQHGRFQLPFHANPGHVAAHSRHQLPGHLHLGQIHGVAGNGLDRHAGPRCRLPDRVEPSRSRTPDERDVRNPCRSEQVAPG